MSFIALASQKSYFNLQKNFLQLQLTQVASEVNVITTEMEYYEENDMDEDAEYLSLEKDEERLESKKDLIESQITVVENEISSLKTLVNNGIKSSCTLNLVGS